MEPVTIILFIIAIVALFLSFSTWFSNQDRFLPPELQLLNMRARKEGHNIFQVFALDAVKELKKRAWPKTKEEFTPARQVFSPIFKPPQVLEILHTFPDGSQLIKTPLDVKSGAPMPVEAPVEVPKRDWFLGSRKVEVIAMSLILVGGVVLVSLFVPELMNNPMKNAGFDEIIGMNPIFFILALIGIILTVVFAGPTVIEVIEGAVDGIRGFKKPKVTDKDRNKAVVIKRVSQGKSLKYLSQELKCSQPNITYLIKRLIKDDKLERGSKGSIKVTERGREYVFRVLGERI